MMKTGFYEISSRAKSINFGRIFEEKSTSMKVLLTSVLTLGAFLIALRAQTTEEGLRHLENENFKSALGVFDQLIAMQPKNHLHHYNKGEVLFAMEDYQASAAAYRKGLEVSSKCDECRIGLAKIELVKGQRDEANDFIESALKGNSKRAGIHALAGRAYLYASTPMVEQALPLLEKARDLDPKQAKHWIYLGDAYYQKKELGQAMTAYETAVEKDKSDPETYVKMSRIWAEGKNLDLAIQQLETAIEISPGYALAYKELYEMFIRARKFDKVVPVLEKYVSLAGTDVDARVRLVKFLSYQAKDYQRAILEGNKILETYPDQYTIHRWLAWSFYETGEFNNSLQSSYRLLDAVRQGDTATMKLYPSDYEYAGKAAIKLKLKDTADAFFEQVIALQPERLQEIAGQLAKSYYDVKLYENAVAWYLRKNEITTLTINELLYLGLSQKLLRDYSGADTTFGTILAKSPAYEYGWLQRADINHKMDTAETKAFLAKPYYDKYIELASAAPEKNKVGLIEAYLYMLVYSAQAGEYDTARSYCDLVLNLDANESRALEYAKILNGNKSKGR